MKIVHLLHFGVIIRLLIRLITKFVLSHDQHDWYLATCGKRFAYTLEPSKITRGLSWDLGCRYKFCEKFCGLLVVYL